MNVETDYQAFVEEVKERNRLFLALSRVREIALNSYKVDAYETLKYQIELILKECNSALGQIK